MEKDKVRAQYGRGQVWRRIDSEAPLVGVRRARRRAAPSGDRPPPPPLAARDPLTPRHTPHASPCTVNLVAGKLDRPLHAG